MPVFKKDNKTIYFAHIPKTAGTTIYHMFIHSGWRIGYLRESKDAKSTYQVLKQEYGSDIFLNKSENKTFDFPIQHVPYKIWKNFGKFDSSFAILRDPIERFKSELRYRYKIKNINNKESFDEFLEKTLKQLLMHPWIFYKGYAGHLLPQHYFVGPQTHLYKIESDFSNQLALKYNLKKENYRFKENISNHNLNIDLNKFYNILLRIFYYYDYQLIRKINTKK